VVVSLVQRREVAEWLVCPVGDRGLLWGVGSPTSVKGLAERVGVAAKTVRRWRDEEVGAFADLVGVVRLERESGVVGGGVGVVVPQAGALRVPGSSRLEGEFRDVRDALFARAQEGDTQAIRVWLQEFGSALVEQERSALGSDLAGLGDVELVSLAGELTGLLAGVLSAGVS
jgi:hypothetical protein